MDGNVVNEGLNLSSTLDFIGYIGRPLAERYTAHFLDANLVSKVKAFVASAFAPRELAFNFA